MKFSENWLKEFLSIQLKNNALAEQLTMAGLEVDSVTDCGNLFTGVVVGHVTATEKHPDAERLTICTVEVSGKQYTVLCGADNVIAGKNFAYAPPGAILPGQTTIGEKSIRGIHSQGMLCSGKELGLSDDGAGILELEDNAKSGQKLESYLSLEDRVIEVSLTPNRGDCLSMLGIAREISVLNRVTFGFPSPVKVAIAQDSGREIEIKHGESCPRYCGRVVSNIDTAARTPLEITERLRRADIRSINIIVDLTNYVMLEMGQPMHAFDNDKLNGRIEIRMATDKEKLSLLDGEEYALQDNTLVIADQNGAIAMAGIMGGEASAVDMTTSNVFLESAFFSPMAIMGRARQYGLHTDASHRFERGVDPQLAAPALERLTGLIIKYCGGSAGPVIEACEDRYLPARQTVQLRPDRIRRLLGVQIERPEVAEILELLGFELEQTSDTWVVRVPSHRFDVEIEVDLIEEVARIHGYHRIPETLPAIKTGMSPGNQSHNIVRTMSAGLRSLGYREIISYSFVDPGMQALIHPDAKAIPLLNPISEELSEMRLSLWPGLLNTLLYNIKRQQDRVRLFESGHIFDTGANAEENRVIAGIIYGNIYPQQWDMKNISSNFYDLKSDIEAIINPYIPVNDLIYSPGGPDCLHSTQSAEIRLSDQKLGVLGALNPKIAQKIGLNRPVYLFELVISALYGKKSLKYEKISKFPWIRRDISIIIDEKVTVFEVIKHVNSLGIQALHNLELFDVYRGEGIDLGKKSLALGLTFQRTSSTLTDEEADVAVQDILKSLHKQFGAILRE